MRYRIPTSATWPSDWLDRILQGDAESRLRELPSNCAALAVTSPPYWDVVDYGVDGQLGQTSYEHYLEQMIGVWRETARVLIPNGSSPSSPRSCRSPRVRSAISTRGI